jgi:hypothetical protein
MRIEKHNQAGCPIFRVLCEGWDTMNLNRLCPSCNRLPQFRQNLGDGYLGGLGDLCG